MARRAPLSCGSVSGAPSPPTPLSSDTALLPFQTPSCPSPLGPQAPSPLPPSFPLHSCPDRTRFGWCSRQDVGRTRSLDVRGPGPGPHAWVRAGGVRPVAPPCRQPRCGRSCTGDAASHTLCPSRYGDSLAVWPRLHQRGPPARQSLPLHSPTFWNSFLNLLFTYF